MIQNLVAENKSLTEEVHRLTEQVTFLTHKLFGRSSEKREPEGLMSLFEDGTDPFQRQRQLKKKSKS